MCCSCSAAMLIPGFSSAPPPPQGISGPLQPSLAVGIDIPQTQTGFNIREGGEVSETPCGCDANTKWLIAALVGLAVGWALFHKR